jgi:hypothetical protein
VPCIQMRELEASSNRYAERRVATIPQRSEKRKGNTGSRRLLGQAQMAYIMRLHLQNCMECNRPR